MSNTDVGSCGNRKSLDVKAKKITMLPVKDLERLQSCPDSGIVKVREELHVVLHPSYCANVTLGLLNYFNNRINQWHPKLHGILANYEKLKLKSPTGHLVNEEAAIHLDVLGEFWVFRPEVGCQLKGTVTKTTPSHVSCLVHGVFNVPCHRPQVDGGGGGGGGGGKVAKGGASSAPWCGTKAQVGKEVRFTVTKTDMSQRIPYIVGDLQPWGLDNSDPWQDGESKGNLVEVIPADQWEKAVRPTPSKDDEVRPIPSSSSGQGQSDSGIGGSLTKKTPKKRLTKAQQLQQQLLLQQQQQLSSSQEFDASPAKAPPLPIVDVKPKPPGRSRSKAKMTMAAAAAAPLQLAQGLLPLHPVPLEGLSQLPPLPPFNAAGMESRRNIPDLLSALQPVKPNKKISKKLDPKIPEDLLSRVLQNVEKSSSATNGATFRAAVAPVPSATSTPILPASSKLLPAPVVPAATNGPSSPTPIPPVKGKEAFASPAASKAVVVGPGGDGADPEETSSTPKKKKKKKKKNKAKDEEDETNVVDETVVSVADPVDDQADHTERVSSPEKKDRKSRKQRKLTEEAIQDTTVEEEPEEDVHHSSKKHSKDRKNKRKLSSNTDLMDSRLVQEILKPRSKKAKKDIGF